MDVLKDKWSPALTVQAVLLLLPKLLAEPNLDHTVLNNEATRNYRQDRESFDASPAGSPSPTPSRPTPPSEAQGRPARPVLTRLLKPTAR
ncbi:ubiquitin-conjugating enzyme E2 [Streptomyces sp. NPDC046939]|uniref:ubiquitin-conjugating enzyme E2 n=1 Tax=Streptomyces sp. NPDC046939 TaxID=3155376 RepID=UPI0033C0B126